MPGGMKFAPKPRELTENENATTFETWKENLLFHLTMDGSYDEFLEDNFTWGSVSIQFRGLKDSKDDNGAVTLSARKKEALLGIMLGSIASYAPVLPRKFITREALSLTQIWNRLRTHYGFRKSGALILDLATFSQGLRPGESYEMMWERLYSFLDDNLMHPADGITHLGEEPIGEEMSPTLLNVCVVLWLNSIHSALPALVKQRYATELKNKSLASIREEISESLDALLAELSGENAAVSRLSYKSQNNRSRNYDSKSSPQKFCILCSSNNRIANHYLSQCKFLPESDRKFMLKSRTRGIDVEDGNESFESVTERVTVSPIESEKTEVKRIDIERSPVLFAKYEKHYVPLTIDSGAQSNVINKSFAKHIGVPINRTSHTATQADGKTLPVDGEVHCTFKFKNHELRFNGLVAAGLKDDVLAGAPFLSANDVFPRPARNEIHIGDKEVVKYDSSAKTTASMQNRIITNILRISAQTVLYPGDSVDVIVPDDLQNSDFVAIEPRTSSPSMMNEKPSHIWLKPEIQQLYDGKVNLRNNSTYPVSLIKHEQVCNIRAVTTPEMIPEPENLQATATNIISESTDYKNIQVNTEVLPDSITDGFHNLHHKYKSVFDTRSIGCYNGASGPFEVVINMGPALPPSRKGRLPLYNRSTFEELQSAFDELEGTVFKKPEEVGVTAEYLNPSFLVRKPSGKKRLVTAFSEVGQYAKPQPALMSNINDTLRTIANWDYIIKTDCTSAYWMMPLSKDSMKFCGVATPYKGVRVYTRAAMGMPGSESALEELLSRVLGNLIAEGKVAKVADDLYAGASNPKDLLVIWEELLQAIETNGLRLSPTKTVCCPSTVNILGWIWCNGKLKASPHRISALVAAEPPTTVLKLRSYIGSFKFLSKVMKSYSDIMSPLEEVVAGKKSSEKIHWTESLINAFRYSQQQLSNTKTLTLPKRSDQLQIVTDAASSKGGIAATLYVIRNGKPYVSGFFNSKLRPHQVNWLPCEEEALCIGAAVKFFSPEIINSLHQTVVLTDSMPCVQAYQKLCKGQFSASARVSTFLSTVSRFQVKLTHIKGSENVISDFASRNPLECPDRTCQVCKFINELEDSVVREVSVQDILQSKTPIPFSSRSSWNEMQRSCKHLSRACAHLKQGTTPSRKATDLRDVKRYLNVARIARDGLMVVDQQGFLRSKSERIVVPRMYLPGLLTSLHIKLQHPSRSQLKQVFTRAFYALDLDEAILTCTNSCHSCTSLSNMPNKFIEQSTTSIPGTIGSHFAADVCQRNAQHIFILRENVSAFTYGRIIPDEKHSTLRDAIITAISEFRCNNGHPVIIRVDPASSCRALLNDKTLERFSINMELGMEKNINKNPRAERSIRELHAELNRLQPEGGPVTEPTLALAICNINSRLRSGGLSAREIYTQRDQYTGEQIPMKDKSIIDNRVNQRLKSHASSEKFKARGKTIPQYPDIKEGELVYINSDRMKTKPRDRYIVTSTTSQDNLVKVQKFVGNQLRARTYTVHKGNLLKVPTYFAPSQYYGHTQEDQSDESYYSESDESDVPKEDHVDTRAEHEQPLRRSTRSRKPPAYLADFDTGTH